MKTDWDYTKLADAYISRPPYSDKLLKRLFTIAGLEAGDRVCDIGAGVGHLTIPLAHAGFEVVAVEPNDAMRANGMRLTSEYPKVTWIEAYGDATGLDANFFNFVSFGSSFSVLDRQAALNETHRLLKDGCWFTCLWNHRDLKDPIQSRIEKIITESISGYEYGIRREDQTAVISNSDMFENVQHEHETFIFSQHIDQTIEAWRSHATLQRQASDKFPAIIEEITKYLNSLGKAEIPIPYTTDAWIARKKV